MTAEAHTTSDAVVQLFKTGGRPLADCESDRALVRRRAAQILDELRSEAPVDEPPRNDRGGERVLAAC